MSGGRVVDPELREFLEGRLSQSAQETRRHFEVVAEGLRGEVRLVAEGVLSLGETMDRRFREVEHGHREILAAVRFSYAELERRLGTLEDDVTRLKQRLAQLEARS